MAKLCSRSEAGGRCWLGHYQRAAKIELPVARFGLLHRHVRLGVVRSEQMGDLVAAGVRTPAFVSVSVSASALRTPWPTAFAEAGFDHVYVHQVGTDQEGFLDFHARELLPRVADENPDRAPSRMV
jgi:hypothetical protein